MRLFGRDFDVIYLAPALLFNTAFLSGIVPALFCIDGAFFAYFSIGIFLVSIIAHLYIMLHWNRYKDYSPVAYAIIQPALHLMVLAFALAVGSTSICSPARQYDETIFRENKAFQYESDIHQVISEG